MHYTKRLTYFTAGYSQIAIVFPFVVAAPRFFSGAITLGGLTQIANAFGQVQGALSWFVNTYGTLAGLEGERRSPAHLPVGARAGRARSAKAAEGVQVVPGDARSIDAEHLDLALPGRRQGGPRAAAPIPRLRVEPG